MIILENDFDVLKQKLAELAKKESLSYDDIYRLKLDMDVLIDRYYFECAG